MLVLTRMKGQSIILTANSSRDFVMELGYGEIDKSHVRIWIFEPKNRLKILREELIDQETDLSQLHAVDHVLILKKERIRISGYLSESQMIKLRLSCLSYHDKLIVLTLFTDSGETIKIEVV